MSRARRSLGVVVAIDVVVALQTRPFFSSSLRSGARRALFLRLSVSRFVGVFLGALFLGKSDAEFADLGVFYLKALLNLASFSANAALSLSANPSKATFSSSPKKSLAFSQRRQTASNGPGVVVNGVSLIGAVLARTLYFAHASCRVATSMRRLANASSLSLS